MIDQGELFDISNPCQGICQVNDKGYCKGCFRSRQERFHWNNFTDYQKQLVVNLCEKRRLRISALASSTSVAEEEIPDSTQLDMFAEPSSSLTTESNPNDSIAATDDQSIADSRPLAIHKDHPTPHQKPSSIRDDAQIDLF